MRIPARTAVLFLGAALLAMSTTYGIASSQSGSGKYDTDGDGLIEVEFLEQLDAIRHDLDGDGIPEGAAEDEYAAAYPVSVEEVVCNNCYGYELARPLDFAAADSYASGAVSTDWTAGDGWRAIGGGRHPFAATFNGNGHAVSSLFITRAARAERSDGGLFGSVGESGVIRETGLLNVNVTGGDFVGPLAGSNNGTVSHSHATGSVSGYGCVGGLVGSNDFGVISSSYAATNVLGGYKYLGGLAGCNNRGTIIASYATGSVSGNTRLGGLVGENSGSVIASYATGGVSDDIEVGGLAGNNSGSVIAGYATGGVRGQKYVGGLVGNNYNGSISAAYSVGEVTGGHYIGGLAGGNGGRVDYSYAVGKVSSDGSIDEPLRYIGGLVGYNPGIVDSGLWDTETSGQQVGIGIEIGEGRSSDLFGKTTAELQSPAGYTGPYQGWDVSLGFGGTENTPDYSLSDFLDFGTPGQYPALKVDFDGDGTPTWQEFREPRPDGATRRRQLRGNGGRRRRNLRGMEQRLPLVQPARQPCPLLRFHSGYGFGRGHHLGIRRYQHLSVHAEGSRKNGQALQESRLPGQIFQDRGWVRRRDLYHRGHHLRSRTVRQLHAYHQRAGNSPPLDRQVRHQRKRHD